MCIYDEVFCTHVETNSVFGKQPCRPNQSSLLYSVSFKLTYNNIECDNEIFFSVSLGFFSLTKVQGKIRGKKNPWIIRQLSKALGLGRKSKKVWDILSISDNTANIKKYHPDETSK